MSTEVRWRRGTTAENDDFTGAEAEITVDTERGELRVHDGVTKGGKRLTHTGTSADEVPTNADRPAINVFAYGVTGDGSTDDTSAFQDAVDDAVSKGYNLWVPNPEDHYYITDDIVVDGASGIRIVIHKNATFKTSGNHSGLQLLDNTDLPKQEAFFIFDECDNYEIVGGKFDCDGFSYDSDREVAASAILSHKCSDGFIRRTESYDLEHGLGSADANGKDLRYTALLDIQSSHITYRDNIVRRVGYGGIESRIGSSDIKVLNNYAEDCTVHFTQHTARYGSISDPQEPTRNVLIDGNTTKNEGSDITTHAENVIIVNNYLYNVNDEGRTVSFRENTKGVICRGNHFVMPDDSKGAACFQFSVSGVSSQVYVGTNYVYNYSELVDTAQSDPGFMDTQYAHSVDDYDGAIVLGEFTGRGSDGVCIGQYANRGNNESRNVVIGKNAGYESNGNEGVLIGASAGYNSEGNSNVAIGDKAADQNTGYSIVATGESAGAGNTGNSLVAVGRRAGQDNTHNNVVLLGEDTTADQANEFSPGERHWRIDFTDEPDSPSDDEKAVIFLRGGGSNPQELKVKFANGTVKTIADDT